MATKTYKHANLSWEEQEHMLHIKKFSKANPGQIFLRKKTIFF